MRLNALRPIALTLVALLAAAGPARAGTITLAELQAAGGAAQLRPASEYRLRVAPQSGAQAAAQQVAQGPQSGTQSTGAQQPNGAPAPAAGGGSTTAGVDATLSQSGGQVETVDLGDVTGTVCDCGEVPRIIPRGGGFPWWTLAGIPLVCVSGVCFGDDEPPSNPPPPPPPPPNPIPEPATLLLFGSGLLAAGAGARRRRRQHTAAATENAEEV